MGLIGNEQLKLTAGWLNTMASASVVAGTIAPLVAVTYGAATGPSFGSLVSGLIG